MLFSKMEGQAKSIQAASGWFPKLTAPHPLNLQHTLTYTHTHTEHSHACTGLSGYCTALWTTDSPAGRVSRQQYHLLVKIKPPWRLAVKMFIYQQPELCFLLPLLLLWENVYQGRSREQNWYEPGSQRRNKSKHRLHFLIISYTPPCNWPHHRCYKIDWWYTFGAPISSSSSLFPRRGAKSEAVRPPFKVQFHT